MSTEKHLPQLISQSNFETRVGFDSKKDSKEFRDKVVEFKTLYPNGSGWTQQVFHKNALGEIESQEVKVLTEAEAELEIAALTPKPTQTSVDVLSTLARTPEMLAIKDDIHNWLNYSQGKNYVWINLIFARPVVSVDKGIITLFNQIIDEDLADANNPITDQIALALKGLLQTIGDALGDG